MRKEYASTLEGELGFFMIEGMGLVAGKLNRDGDMIKKPRAVQVLPAQQDQPAQLRFGELIGSPDEIFLERKPVVAYKVRNKEIINLYVTTTTGLVLTPNNTPLPPAGSGGLVS